MHAKPAASHWIARVTVGALLVSMIAISDASSSGATDGPGQPVPTPEIPAERETGPLSAMANGADAGPITVELVSSSADLADTADAVERAGGTVLGDTPESILVRATSDVLSPILATNEELDARPPSRVDIIPAAPAESSGLANTTRAQLTSITNADAWHGAGFRGGGVKVGIVDFFDSGSWSNAQAAGSVPAAAGTFCQVRGLGCDLWTAGSTHGVAVAEMVHAMAPDSQLYLATVETASDLSAAVAWFDGVGVTIITRSLGSILDGPGDGSGLIDSVVDDAVSRGIAWFNSAGNHASASGTTLGSYWRGPFTDVDSDGFMEFAPGVESLEFTCSAGIQGLRWSDWSGDATDYDAYIADPVGNVLYTSTRDQTAGASPLEAIDWPNLDCDAHPVVHLFITLADPGNGTAGDTIEFVVNRSRFKYSSNPYSAASPVSDSANPGSASIGAIDPADGVVIAPYSSWGPTNDGRTKPDLVAPSCIDSVATAPSCFNGTSAASPVAAGAAALVSSAGSASTPQGIIEFLEDHAVDRGPLGVDTIYGHGQVRLPVPPADNSPPVATPDGTYLVPIGGSTARPAPGVLANDTDPDGDPLTAVLETPPSHGTVTLHADGAFTYTHSGTTAESDEFRYRARDSDGALSEPVAVRLQTTDDIGDTHMTALVDPTQGRWRLFDIDGSMVADYYFGNPGDTPILGDWNCDGRETPGMYRPSDGFVYLRNEHAAGNADIRFFFGNPGDVPIAGDFDGDGCDTVSIYRPSNQTFHIINELGADDAGLGAAEAVYVFGDPGDTPFVGDCDGDGIETAGLHRASTGLVYFRNSHTQGNADAQFIYGDPDDRVIAGDWNGDGVFSPALFRPSTTTMYFRFANTQGVADTQFVVPDAEPSWIPVGGSMM